MTKHSPARRPAFALPTRLLALVTAAVVGVPGSAQAAAAGPPEAEIYATNNTAVITDPASPRLRTSLRRFDRQVRRIIRAHGTRTRRSALLDGVFWSGGLRRTTYERSRRFDLDRTDPIGLRRIANVIRRRYRQESVLTFERLPRTSPRADAVRIEVPGLDVRRLHDGLVADPAARGELYGGSVTRRGRLILVAELADLAIARTFVTRIGGRWSSARLRYGDREFVGQAVSPARR